MVWFVVKLEILVENEWFEIERYDNYHGYVHNDIIGKNREKKQVIKVMQANFGIFLENFRFFYMKLSLVPKREKDFV